MSPSSGLAEPELHDIHETASIAPYLSDVWARRGYIWYVSVSELRSQQITTVLGNLWHLLNPILSIAVYYLIFGLLLKTTRGVDNFILFLTVGIFLFSYTQRITTAGATAIVSNPGLLKSIKFPRVLLPLTSTVTETLGSLSTFALIYIVALVTGQPFRWQWILLVLILAVQFLFNLGSAMIAARATTHFRDMTQILPFLFRLLLYASGVIFSAEAYATGKWAWAFIANPLYCFITIGRWSILGGDLDPALIVSALTWTLVLLIGGFLWFRSAEERYARD